MNRKVRNLVPLLLVCVLSAAAVALTRVAPGDKPGPSNTTATPAKPGPVQAETAKPISNMELLVRMVALEERVKAAEDRVKELESGQKASEMKLSTLAVQYATHVHKYTGSYKFATVNKQNFNSLNDPILVPVMMPATVGGKIDTSFEERVSEPPQAPGK